MAFLPFVGVIVDAVVKSLDRRDPEPSQQAQQISELQAIIDNQTVQNKKQQEEVQLALKELKEQIQREKNELPEGTESELRSKSQEKYKLNLEKVNFLITGHVGTGKSSLLNHLAGLTNTHQEAAETRMREVNSTAQVKLATKLGPNVWLYDSQGSGTDRQKSAAKEIGLDAFNGVIFTMGNSLTRTDVLNMRQCQRTNVPFIIAKTKADMMENEVYCGEKADIAKLEDEKEGLIASVREICREREITFDATRQMFFIDVAVAKHDNERFYEALRRIARM